MCDLCPAGKYTGATSSTACDDCTSGYLCVMGSSAPQPCPGGTHAEQAVLESVGFLSSLGDCVVCPEGTFCSTGALSPTSCSAGTVQPEPGQGTCAKCEAGMFINASGQTACFDCPPASYCEDGASAALPCHEGTYSSVLSVGILKYRRPR